MEGSQMGRLKALDPLDGRLGSDVMVWCGL